MCALGIPKKIIKFIENTLFNSLYVVHTGYSPTEPITLKTGLKQGDSSSPILFLLFIEPLLRMLRESCRGFHFKYPFTHSVAPVTALAFCDDLLVTTNSKSDTILALKVIEEFDN